MEKSSQGQTIHSKADMAVEKINWASNIKFVLAGILFGFLLYKGEVVNWFRIQEMFRFQSFHMYGIIGSAVMVGAISVLLIKRFQLKTINGESISIKPKSFSWGNVYGGLLFGFGWAITGACPGPLYVQVGAGATMVVLTIFFALLGTWVYGAVREKLPH